MRATITAIAVVAVLALDQPGFAQGTSSPSAAPKQSPVARKQTRDPNAAPMPPPRPAAPAAPAGTLMDDDADARMNRALNSICRGC